MRNDETIEQVFDRREISPALLRVDIGNIRDPFLVGLGGREITSQDVRVPMRTPDLRPLWIEFTFPGHGMDANLVHQPQNGLVVDANPPVLLEPDGDPSVAIGLMRPIISFQDDCHSFRIRIRSLDPLGPGIISSSRNPEEIAHRRYGVSFSVSIDDPILRSASIPLRNSVWNFFSSSFSISRRAIYASLSFFLGGLPTGRPRRFL